MFLSASETKLSQDLIEVDRSIMQVAEAIYHTVSILKREHEQFWRRDPEDMLALLNYNVPKTLEIFQANQEIGTLLNARLDVVSQELRTMGKVDPFKFRAPIDIPAGYSFDQATGKFVYQK